MTINLIGLHGKAQSGKDTAYGLLSKRIERVARDAFADRLKHSAVRNFKPESTVGEAYYFCEWLKEGGVVRVFRNSDDESPAAEVTGREFLQHYGTEAHRQVFADDFWVDAVLPDRTDLENFGREDGEDWDILVVTDARFPNEAEAIREAGGEVWHIIRPELEEGEQDSHASEQPLPEELVDKVILNDGTLEEFEEALLDALALGLRPEGVDEWLVSQ